MFLRPIILYFFLDLKSSFRGFPLQGKKIPVPKGYTGVTFYEYKKPETEGAERNIYATGTFTEFTYWNYDKLPSKNDPFMSALDWIDIAEAVSIFKYTTTISYSCTLFHIRLFFFGFTVAFNGRLIQLKD